MSSPSPLCLTDTHELAEILRTVQPKKHCIIRVPSLRDEGFIKRALDLGAEGIIVPQTNTVQEVRTCASYRHSVHTFVSILFCFRLIFFGGDGGLCAVLDLFSVW